VHLVEYRCFKPPSRTRSKSLGFKGTHPVICQHCLPCVGVRGRHPSYEITAASVEQGSPQGVHRPANCMWL